MLHSQLGILFLILLLETIALVLDMKFHPPKMRNPCFQIFLTLLIQKVHLIYILIIITTRPTGGLHQGYKPLLLGQRLKALAFSLDCGNSVYTAFPQLRSSHIALDSSLPLKGYCYYLALTLKRVFIFLYTQLIHCYIMLFLLLDIFFYCSLI